MTNQQCSKLVCGTTPFSRDQCSREGVLFEDGEYWCMWHAPSAYAARQKAQEEECEAKLGLKPYERHAKEFHDALVEIVNSKGCNSVQANYHKHIARAALAKMEEEE